jgi:hypothetical protein
MWLWRFQGVGETTVPACPWPHLYKKITRGLEFQSVGNNHTMPLPSWTTSELHHMDSESALPRAKRIHQTPAASCQEGRKNHQTSIGVHPKIWGAPLSINQIIRAHPKHSSKQQLTKPCLGFDHGVHLLWTSHAIKALVRNPCAITTLFAPVKS